MEMPMKTGNFVLIELQNIFDDLSKLSDSLKVFVRNLTKFEWSAGNDQMTLFKLSHCKNESCRQS